MTLVSETEFDSNCDIPTLSQQKRIAHLDFSRKFSCTRKGTEAIQIVMEDMKTT